MHSKTQQGIWLLKEKSLRSLKQSWVAFRTDLQSFKGIWALKLAGVQLSVFFTNTHLEKQLIPIC